jgi:toxin secretion/phage lysis holin
MEHLKSFTLSCAGIIGSGIAYLFGGWSQSMIVLLIFMTIDYFTGLIVAGVLGNSPKSKTGALSSKAGQQGLARKTMIWVFVLIGHQADIQLGLAVIREAVVISFILNELLSILENAGLMGVPIPGILTRVIEILKDKEVETQGVKKSA